MNPFVYFFSTLLWFVLNTFNTEIKCFILFFLLDLERSCIMPDLIAIDITMSFTWYFGWICNKIGPGLGGIVIPNANIHG